MKNFKDIHEKDRNKKALQKKDCFNAALRLYSINKPACLVLIYFLNNQRIIQGKAKCCTSTNKAIGRYSGMCVWSVSVAVSNLTEMRLIKVTSSGYGVEEVRYVFVEYPRILELSRLLRQKRMTNNEVRGFLGLENRQEKKSGRVRKAKTKTLAFSLEISEVSKQDENLQSNEATPDQDLPSGAEVVKEEGQGISPIPKMEDSKKTRSRNILDELTDPLYDASNPD
jgi:hypothetical protein